MNPRTGAERYFHDRQQDPTYAVAYESARRRIDDVDRIVRAIDDQRIALGLTKAELARRIGTRPEAVRRLLSPRHANPTLATVVALANELELDLVAVPARRESTSTRQRGIREEITSSHSGGGGTRRRTA